MDNSTSPHLPLWGLTLHELSLEAATRRVFPMPRPGFPAVTASPDEWKKARSFSSARGQSGRFEDTVRQNDFIAASVETGKWDRVIDYVNREVFDKPAEYYSLDKLRHAAAVDRRLTLREILEKIFGLIPGFKSKDELLEEEFAKFVADYKPTEAEAILALKTYFKAYVSSDQVRHIIESGQLTDLATNPSFSTRDFKAVPAR